MLKSSPFLWGYEGQDPRRQLATAKERLYILVLVLLCAGTALWFLATLAAGASSVTSTAALVFVAIFNAASVWAVVTKRLRLWLVEESVWLVNSVLVIFALLFGIYWADLAVQSRLAVVGSYLWLPVIYATIFATNDTKGALLRSVPVYVLILLISLPQALRRLSGSEELGAGTSLLLGLYLVNAVLICVLYFFGTLRDWALETAVVIERMRLMADNDSLTGLANRRYTELMLEEEIKYAQRYDTPLSVIIFDVDNFKSVNDTYGHNIGDAILSRLAELIQNNSRGSDVLGRWGGEEFLIASPHASLQDALLMSERLAEKLRETDFETVGRVSASFGVATLGPGDSTTTLIQRADAALYQAKKLGKDRVFSEEV